MRGSKMHVAKGQHRYFNPQRYVARAGTASYIKLLGLTLKCRSNRFSKSRQSYLLTGVKTRQEARSSRGSAILMDGFLGPGTTHVLMLLSASLCNDLSWEAAVQEQKDG